MIIKNPIPVVVDVKHPQGLDIAATAAEVRHDKSVLIRFGIAAPKVVVHIFHFIVLFVELRVELLDQDVDLQIFERLLGRCKSAGIGNHLLLCSGQGCIGPLGVCNGRGTVQRDRADLVDLGFHLFRGSRKSKRAKSDSSRKAQAYRSHPALFRNFHVKFLFSIDFSYCWLYYKTNKYNN